MKNTHDQILDLSATSIHAWIQKHGIKNEKGEPIEFTEHLFLYDIYRDQSDKLVAMKAAQVGFSTLAILKNFYDAWSQRIEVIYTLPTDNNVSAFVSGKVDRIIANNPILRSYAADKDAVDQKQVGQSMIYFRGTWTKKAAIMITADRLVHDEKDSSKPDVIADYQSRLQHSKVKQTHLFSHPSLPEIGIHADWLRSDQKHWYVICPHCQLEQFLEWNIKDPHKMSVDFERKEFVCKACYGVLDRKIRATGRWIATYPERKISGYWIPLLIAPWISAAEIIEKYEHPDTTSEFFYTKVLGLPYADGSAKLLRQHFLQNLTGKSWAPDTDERVIIGIDTGLKLDYVIGNTSGLFHHGNCDNYGVLDGYMKRWPRAIAVIDHGGDLTGSRQFFARWPGRVFLCMLTGDRTTKELVQWSQKDEYGAATADRNRMIQLVVDEFREKGIRVHGTEGDWYEYWLDWNHLSKTKILDPDTNQIKGYKWIRNGRDHLALATVFWRVGMMRFAGSGAIYTPTETRRENSYMMNPNSTVSFNPDELFRQGVELSLDALEEEQEDDWRL